MPGMDGQELGWLGKDTWGSVGRTTQLRGQGGPTGSSRLEATLTIVQGGGSYIHTETSTKKRKKKKRSMAGNQGVEGRKQKECQGGISHEEGGGQSREGEAQLGALPPASVSPPRKGRLSQGSPKFPSKFPMEKAKLPQEGDTRRAP